MAIWMGHGPWCLRNHRKTPDGPGVGSVAAWSRPRHVEEAYALGSTPIGVVWDVLTACCAMRVCVPRFPTTSGFILTPDWALGGLMRLKVT
jgi:hypothetical protein